MARMVTIGAALMLLQPSIVPAQSDYGGGWAVPSFETSQSIIRDKINREMMDCHILKGAQDKGEHPPRPAQATLPSANLESLQFAPSLAVRRSIESEFKGMGIDPAAFDLTPQELVPVR